MPAHFIKRPTLEQVIEYAIKKGCTLKTLEGELRSNDYSSETIQYLERIMEDGTPPRTYILPANDMKEELSLDVLRALCVHLMLDWKVFATRF